MDKALVAKRLRYHREASGLTQFELATRVGASLRTVQNWEDAAHPSIPKTEFAVKLSALYGVAVSEIFPVDDLPEHYSSIAKVIREPLGAYESPPPVASRSASSPPNELGELWRLFLDACSRALDDNRYTQMLAFTMTDRLIALDPENREIYDEIKRCLLARVSQLDDEADQ